MPESRTLLRPETLTPASTAATWCSRIVAWWTLVTLARTLDGLVDGLGRRLGLPVGVELRVVAFIELSVKLSC